MWMSLNRFPFSFIRLAQRVVNSVVRYLRRRPLSFHHARFASFSSLEIVAEVASMPTHVYSLREFMWMAEGKGRHDWDQTSLVACLLFNVACY
jgi:hypothetical protein